MEAPGDKLLEPLINVKDFETALVHESDLKQFFKFTKGFGQEG